MAFSVPAAFEFLERAHQSQRLAHAYLITGPTGSGKRALASQLAWLINGPGPSQPLPEPEAGFTLPDLYRIEPESKSRLIRVAQMRELEQALQMRASHATRRKIGIICDADRMNEAAANSFLKTLEEPPAQSLLLLLTAHPEMLLETILSRCILVPLVAPPASAPSPEEQRLLDRLVAYFEQPEAGLAEVFLLVREFTALLADVKSAAQAQGEDELKKEESRYKQTTDGEWLEGREAHFKALGESRYLQVRAIFVDRLLQWWGDVLREQHGATHRDFPAYTAATSALAQRFTPADVLQRLSALERLRENFGRNVQEALAIEVAFLKAFPFPASSATR